MSSKRLGLIVALVLVGVLVAACAPAAGNESQVATLQAQLAAAQQAGAGGANAQATVTALQAQLQAAQQAAGGTPQPSFKPTFKNADTLVWMTYGEPDTLDPAPDYETSGAHIIRNMYDTLVFFKGGSVTDYVPMLATDWKMSDDGKTYTFTIRKGVKFHDGSDLTPDDVAYSFQRNLLSGWDDDLGGPQWIMMEQLFGVNVLGAKGTKDGVTGLANGDDTKVCQMVMDAVKADDTAGTVTFALNHPSGYFLQTLVQSWGSIMSAGWMEKNGDWDGKCDNWRKWYGLDISKTTLYNKENGTGPYMLDHWTPGTEIALKANPNWWVTQPLWDGSTIKGVPSIKNIIIKDVGEWSTRLAAFQAGDADEITVDSAYYTEIDPMVKEYIEGRALKDDKSNLTTKNPNGSAREYHAIPQFVSFDIFMNEGINAEGGNPFIGSGKLDGKGIPPDFFSDVHVRKAFNYCFDFGTYMKDVLQGEAIQRRGPIASDMPGYDANSPIYTYDLDKCASEFGQAWNGDVAKNGFTLTLAYNAGNDNRKAAMELLRDGLLKANAKMAGGDRNKQNFSVSVVGMAWPSYLAAQRNSQLAVYGIGWLEDYHHPNNWVGPYMSSTGTYGGREHFADALTKAWDALIEQAKGATDLTKQNDLYGQLQKAAYDNAIDIFVDQPLGRRYEQLWLSGWYDNPLFAHSYYAAMSKVAPQ